MSGKRSGIRQYVNGIIRKMRRNQLASISLFLFTHRAHNVFVTRAHERCAHKKTTTKLYQVRTGTFRLSKNRHISRPLKVLVIVVRQRVLGGLSQLALVHLHQFLVHLDLGRFQGRHLHELEIRVAGDFSGQPEEGLFKVVVGLCGDVIILQIFLSVEYDCLGFDFSVFDVDLVSAEHNWDILADSDEITMPVGHVLVGDSRRDVEHDDCALAHDVVAVAKAAKFLLACGVPYVESDWSSVGVKDERVDFDSQRGDVLLFKLACQMTLYESRLTGTAVADEN